MKRRIFALLLLVPSAVMSQTHVNPEGDKLFWFAGLLILIIMVSLIFGVKRKNQKNSKTTFFNFKRKRLAIELTKDRLIRPKNLTLSVKNTGNCVVDLEPPLLVFRKLWSKRKFKLKKINNREVYPLYLEPGKTHTVTIELSRFFEHDKKLKRFYWGRIFLQDVNGKKFNSKHIALRKSLYS